METMEETKTVQTDHLRQEPAEPPAQAAQPTVVPPANGAAVARPAPAAQPDLQKVARIVSLVLHPFLVSPLAIVLILWLDRGDLVAALGWAGLCAAFVVTPALIYLRRKLKRREYTDADVSVREHRYGFYLFGAGCMAACYATLLWLQAPGVLVAGFTAALVALVAAIIINRFWTKVSIHSGAAAGVAAAAAFYSLPLAGLLILFALAVSWARLVTRRHTTLEAATAWAVAVACVVVVFGPLR